MIRFAAVCLFCSVYLSADADPYRGFMTTGTVHASCCGGQDCRPLPDGLVRVVPGGYEVAGYGMVPNADAQPGFDSHYHACFLSGTLRCFLTPGYGT